MVDIFRGPANSPNCAQCPCAVNGQPVRPIRGAGAVGSLAVVGEGPSTEEVHQGWPFVGPSGKLLQQVFSEANIDRHSIWITNALLCQRPYDPAKLAKAIDCCRPRLANELALVKPRAVVALGGSAAIALDLPIHAISDARGTVQNTTLVDTPVITALHPAAILRGGGAGNVKGAGKQKMNVDAQYVFLAADVAKAYALATGAAIAPWTDDIQLVTDVSLEAFAKVATVLENAVTRGSLTIDLEWGKDNAITWLGLATTDSAVSVYWPRMTYGFGMDIFRNVKAAGESALPKLFHNLQADVAVWEAQIGPIRGVLEDTMLMHHAAFPGAAHDLQNVASQFLLVPPWKADRRGETKQAARTFAAQERAAKKSLKQMEHELRNAESHALAGTRKVTRKVGHKARNDAAHFLKLLGENDK